MDSLQWLNQFHLLRPYWLLALVPLALVLWLYSRNQAHSHSWASVIDQKLLPHLLKGSTTKRKAVPLRLLFLLGALLIIALSGPAFEKRQQPVYKAKSALVILLDLSRSMDATDIKPSRLSRAHFKINDILKLRKEGQTALITYAADAFTVSPLTEDANTIAAQIPALETHIMPNQGSRLDIALDKAQQLFINAGHSKGHILVITDSINAQANTKIKQLNADAFLTSILAIGTEEGAPIAAQNGGFVKDNAGSIVVPKLDIQSLKQAAQTGGGNFSLLTSGDRDINRLLSAIDINRQDTGNEQLDASGNAFKTDTWHEEGPWLLLLVLPFAAYAFRKGLVFALLIFILPLPQPAHAIEWGALWKNNNQRAAQALEAGDSEKAAELFNDPQWKAAAEYKAGNFQQAADLLNDIDNADAHYNRGNALAKSGQLEEAISAYDQALKQQPEHADAEHNKQLVKHALQQQQQQDSENQDQDQDQEQQDSDNSQQQESQDSSSSQQQDSQNQSSQNNEENNEENTQNQQPEQQSDKPPEEPQEKSPEQQAEQSQQEAEEETASQQEQQQAEQQDEQQAMQETASDAEPDLDQQQTQQWLKKIPDDPGGLLRRKFKYQYGRDKKTSNEDPW